MAEPSPYTYARAGVNLEAAARVKARMGELARHSRRPEVLADVGPFAGLFHLRGRRDPVLVASCDGVGTKARIAALLGAYEGLGRDLVSLNVNDILTVGAEPLFFLDYIAHHGLPEEALLALVRGMAEACREVGCALLGGETAEMPDVYAPGDFDLAGFVVGAAERGELIDGSRIAPGDVLLGLPSAGLHTNGYSLVRRVFRVGTGEDPAAERQRLEEYVPELGCTLGEELLRPHRCYLREVMAVRKLVKGIAHVTGGGIEANLARILPSGLRAVIDRRAWEVPPIFRLIQERGRVPDDEMWRVFNMGIGMVLVAGEGKAAQVQASLEGCVLMGAVRRGSGSGGD
jgi:phosphoribosylformylglycinamidine cyclo-ligase